MLFRIRKVFLRNPNSDSLHCLGTLWESPEFLWFSDEDRFFFGFFFISFLEPERRLGSCFHILLKLQANDSAALKLDDYVHYDPVWTADTSLCNTRRMEGKQELWNLSRRNRRRPTSDLQSKYGRLLLWKQNSTELRDSSNITELEIQTWSWTRFSAPTSHLHSPARRWRDKDAGSP